VVGELPHEADPRSTAAWQPQPVPAEGFFKRTLSRWARKLHLTRERSG
jgi:hypothetical protein